MLWKLPSCLLVIQLECLFSRPVYDFPVDIEHLYVERFGEDER